jgi:PAS domain S-box-containing protein
MAASSRRAVIQGNAWNIAARKRADEEIRARAQVFTLLAAVGLSLARADSLASALQECAEALVEHLGIASARIWAVKEPGGELELEASAGSDLHLGRLRCGVAPGMAGFTPHPLIVDDRLVGVMALRSRQPLPDVVRADLASIADHLAVGIERHRNAEALRAAEERTRFALEAAGVGIWDLDYASGVLRWSPLLEAQYGLPPGTFGGTFEAFIALIHPEDRQPVRETIASAARTRSDVTLRFRTVWSDGTTHWISGVGREYVGADGTPVRGVGVSFDVTGRHQLEEQYRQAQKMEVVGRLASGVAHDFNNLLTAILGYSELLLADSPPGDPHRADLDEIQKAGLRAARLTHQLLAFSRKEVIEPTVLDLDAVVGEVQAMLARVIGDDVIIRLGLASDQALVKADRGQVEQIVMNIAVNARDAMPTGGTLTIETASVDLEAPLARAHATMPPGPYVVLTMTDTGTGMTADVQAHLFEPFFTTKGVGKGTGLGLATVLGMVTASGGSVDVSSELGKGTSFTIYLPRVAATTAIVAPAPPAVLSGHEAATVLVVDDSDGLRRLIGRMLERLGHSVLLAANADEALRLFEQEASIDLLLTDVVMPGASGPDLTRLLMDQRPGLKVIYMSGYANETIVRHGLLKPGIAFLHKPFSAEALGRKVGAVLGHSASSAPRA